MKIHLQDPTNKEYKYAIRFFLSASITEKLQIFSSR